jgi:hypothetical protein
MPSATDEVEVPEEMQQAAREIAQKLLKSDGSDPVAAPLEGDDLLGVAEPSTGSGHSSDDPVVVRVASTF